MENLIICLVQKALNEQRKCIKLLNVAIKSYFSLHSTAKNIDWVFLFVSTTSSMNRSILSRKNSFQKHNDS